ncbi:methyltransferase domain-containing protein [Georgenia alba]|uniref:Methyltransferase domain-containing protein n=1 Tax=Georgenia alba TaxID=2233858 RepID=A0ABW2QDB1_9MICO
MTTRRTPPEMWDAHAYERFGDFRARPIGDLLHRVEAADPRLVVDLGCGSGASTRPLAARWPGARVVGVDSSPDMLARARQASTSSRIQWVEADITTWEPPSAPDVIITNAVLQWIPGHLELLPRWISSLAPGGWFAMQVPGNADEPSHALMRDLVADLPEGPELLPLLLGKTGVEDPAGYAAALHAAGAEEIDAWETTYVHLLDPDNRLENAVLEWVRGTGLRPLLGKLDADREAAFLARYGQALQDAYPRTSMGVPLPFRRVFAVGRRPA